MEKIFIDISKSIVENNVILSYLFFFISQSLQIIFPPYPGDMILILEGYLSEISNLNIIVVIINAVLATFLSSILLYEIGNKYKYKILNFRIINFLFDINKVNRLKQLFNKFGSIVVIFSKVIPGIFSITVLSAGMFGTEKSQAYISIFFINLVHHSILIILGKKLKENWVIIFHKLSRFNKDIIILCIIGLFIYFLLYRLKSVLFK